jgi:ribosomal protein S18 acetylase RimI-like enzyme
MLASHKDLDKIDRLAVLNIQDMKDAKISQWTLDYPRKKHYIEDVERNGLYVYKLNGIIIGVMTLLKENDAPYKTIDTWMKHNSLVIHRVLVDPKYRNQKVAQKLFNFAYELGIEGKYESIKIDTHLENYKMRRFLLKNDFQEIGYLKVIDRIAYEKILKGE